MTAFREVIKQCQGGLNQGKGMGKEKGFAF